MTDNQFINDDPGFVCGYWEIYQEWIAAWYPHTCSGEDDCRAKVASPGWCVGCQGKSQNEKEKPRKE